jgi:hypothetical protein
MRNIAAIRYKPPSANREPEGGTMLDVAGDLRQHLDICGQLLRLSERENAILAGAEAVDLKPFENLRNNLLPKLEQSLARLKQHRQRWQQLSPAERSQQPEVGVLLRQNQDMIMKIIVVDRENERGLLRRGMVPSQHLPPAQRQQANFVSELYRRQGGRFA